jgi:hypothetical protein
MSADATFFLAWLRPVLYAVDQHMEDAHLNLAENRLILAQMTSHLTKLDPSDPNYRDQWLEHTTGIFGVMTRILRTLTYISRLRRQYALLYDTAEDIWRMGSPPPVFRAGEEG